MKLFIYFCLGVMGILIALYQFRGPRQEVSIENVVMPGLLTKAHVEYESQCAKCHAPFTKEAQGRLCMDCHKEIKEDIGSRQGFHGNMAETSAIVCISCHTEHQGRDGDIAGLDKSGFNHDLTDFPLRGAHARTDLDCLTCHRPGKKYRQASTTCSSCHQDMDIHKGQLGSDCAKCHNPTSWQGTYFDHADTSFPLMGKHRDVTCNACHLNETYKDTPKVCVSCHLINDVHNSPREERCERCHSLEGWRGVVFDHNKETEFFLKDRHTRAGCAACHRDLLFTVKLARECIVCHQGDDVHKGKHGQRCEDCHATAGWEEAKFDHDLNTDFPLRGRHREASCEACHKETVQASRIEKICQSCHMADDVHHGALGPRCESCHNEYDWGKDIRFDHDLNRFPLIGMHSVTACKECHLTPEFKNTQMDCIACHKTDDYHKAVLGTNCGTCHNPNGWRLWEFDHNTQTGFSLEGAHASLVCEDCHQSAMGKEVRKSTNCAACHDQDDAHNGRFGRQCERCHTVNSFKVITIKP
jgi:hypothetical protein